MKKTEPSRKSQKPTSLKSKISPNPIDVWGESERRIQAGQTINLEKLRAYLKANPEIAIPNRIAQHLLDYIEGKIRREPNRPKKDPFDEYAIEYRIFYHINEMCGYDRWAVFTKPRVPRAKLDLLSAIEGRRKHFEEDVLKNAFPLENFVNGEIERQRKLFKAQILDIQAEIDATPKSKSQAFRILAERSHEVLGVSLSRSTIRDRYDSYERGLLLHKLQSNP